MIAAEVNADCPDFGHLEPMVTAAEHELEKAGVTETPEVVVADPGYWHQVQMESVVARGIQVIIPPDARNAAAPGRDGTVGYTRSCAASLRPRSAARFIESARG